MFSASPPPPAPRRRGPRMPQSRVITPPTRAPSSQPMRLLNSTLHDDLAQHLPHASSDRALDPSVVFSHSDQLTIGFYGSVPQEVRQILVAADLYGDQFSGAVDPITGYALLVSPSTVFCWQPKPSSRGSITCYLFPSPGILPRAAAFSHVPLPVASLVHYGSIREPGLILISQTGELRYWESIGAGLSGAESYVSNQLMLQDGELVLALHRCDHLLFVASTTTGRLFRVSISTNGHVLAVPFTASSQNSWNIFSWGSSAPRPSTSRVVSIALGTKTRQGQEIWVLTENALQHWLVSPEGWEQFIGDAAPNLHQTLLDLLGSIVDLELLDVAVSNGSVTLLLSHQGAERRLYELVEMRQVASALAPVASRGLSYEPSRPVHAPRLALVADGEAALVQFSDALVLSFRGNDVQELTRLRYSRDRIFGFALLAEPGAREARVLLNNMMLSVTIGSAPIVREGENEEMVGATLLRQVMTRAIMYGPVTENPLSFRFPLDVDGGNLMAGSEALSHAVLVSDPELLKPAVDLTTQIKDRVLRLSFLINFINDNAVQHKLSPASRQRLLYDAEQLHAAQELWAYYNESRRNDSGEHNDVLVQAIELYMHSIGALEHEDLVRAFFKNEIHHMAALLGQIAVITRDVARSYEGSHGLSAVLREANRVVLKILSTAHTFRDRQAPLYALPNNAGAVFHAEPWTSSDSILQTTVTLFDQTDRLLASSGDSEADRSMRDAEVERQLCDLGSAVLRSFSERLTWLEHATRQGTGNERERALLQEQFILQRPRVLRALVSRGCVTEAFSLAEEYRDYRTLTELCHEHLEHPDERLEVYIEAYQEDYAFDLYSFWIERGTGKRLFENAELHPRLVDGFFKHNANPRISWIQDIAQRRFDGAAKAFLDASSAEPTVGGTQLMLSIGKLCQLAQIVPGKSEVSVVEFNNELDFIAMHHALVQEFRESVSETAQGSLEQAIDEIVSTYAAKLDQDRPASATVFRELVRQLLQGRTLGVEDLIDVITWKDNASTPNRFAEALKLRARAGAKIPEAKARLLVGSIWRRALLQDDWTSIEKTAHLTDEQLTTRMRRTALYHTFRAAAESEEIIVEDVWALPLVLQPPLSADVDARWPELTPRERTRLAEEFAGECASLLEFDIRTLWDAVAHREREDRAHSFMSVS